MIEQDKALAASSDDLIAQAIVEAFGERCPDHDPDCHTCRVWAQYDALASNRQKLERAEQAVEFVARWAWRTDPPHASRKLADSERLSCIKCHPVIKKAAAPHIELAEQEARAALGVPAHG